MALKDELNARTFDELADLGAELVEADDLLLWSLIQARKDAGYTQSEFAELLGIKQATLSKFESQEADPRLSTIRRYARTLGAHIAHQVTAPTGHVSCSSGWRSVQLDPVRGSFLVSDSVEHFTFSAPATARLQVVSAA